MWGPVTEKKTETFIRLNMFALCVIVLHAFCFFSRTPIFNISTLFLIMIEGYVVVSMVKGEVQAQGECFGIVLGAVTGQGEDN